MNILIIEDEALKSEKIRTLIVETCDPSQPNVTEVRSINEAIHALGGGNFDLIIADLVLPQITGSLDSQDATSQWCEHIENHASSRLSSWVIMTGYSDIAKDARQSFARHGVAVIEYDDGDSWRKILSNRIKEQFVNPPMDFVIICALEKERAALQHCDDVSLGNFMTVTGLDCRDIKIGTLSGVAVTLPRAGLVSAAIGTVKAAEMFRPKAITMCGICGGIEGESELGDLIVPDISWNYQAGKIVGGRLKPELVQTHIPPNAQTKLQQMANGDMSRAIRKGLFHSELSQRKILTPPMVSGSQVVSDKDVASSIALQSRKVGALDMEVASVFAAAHDFFNGGGIFFAAKTVVDLADENKDDRYHEYGCVLSARFIVKALNALLAPNLQ
ncbi:phosphorylase family protein [Gluconobacter kanchanaburiensis]|uniref:Nucleoside phosphorylase domain-containing protein n=1 Tax=Gluconobacter kanchanaburiensis NBRC 103587 TaxID=1307948 RepID=A0A511B9G4_9PROT|nr:response regulator [Gluconobacter kanchanaburiensis]MBF0862799.1 response regulator [Gluconobacter kanchanaburiensis]GBR69067.1 response regulator receiver domain-containing protein [Gluconobacter kanchanaburiensis NBRC 103587]GEK97080.1 hypothetical protein GKA01_22770 [Gluconobacter kanchanaburiensis NBRC 103587]